MSGCFVEISLFCPKEASDLDSELRENNPVLTWIYVLQVQMKASLLFVWHLFPPLIATNCPQVSFKIASSESRDAVGLVVQTLDVSVLCSTLTAKIISWQPG